MGISCATESFGKLQDGSEVSLYRLQNGKGITAEILSYGGIIHKLLVPDRDGNVLDVVLGADDLEGYMKGTCTASVIGRFANRISGGQFSAGGKVWTLEKNAPGECTLHSGSGNYARRNFGGKTFERDGCAGVALSLRDNGEGGFPGGMDVTVTYTLDEAGNFKIRYEGTPEADTPISMTNHVYFNLAGQDSGSVEDHLCQLDADFCMVHHETGLPTGEIVAVKGTDMDFTSPTPFKRGFNSKEPQLSRNGYDHNYCLRGRGMRRGGVVKDPESGRCLEFFTDLPGVQLYTGLHLRLRKAAGKGGAEYSNGDGFCLETQHYPDSVNMSQFPSPMYKAGEKFESETVFRFYTE